MYQDGFTIRLAEREDASLIASYIRELADYEGDLAQIKMDPPMLERYLFDQNDAEALIGEYDGNPVGFVLLHSTFSTFMAKPGIALVDLYIVPEARNRGFGRRMLAQLAKITKARNCEHLEWWVHDWNRSAARFYSRYGTRSEKDIRVYRLSDNALDIF